MANGTNTNNFSDILKQLINLLPSSYNKEISDTNYYRLLRALSLELDNAQIEVQKLTDDMYLQTVSADSIYNNFGTLVKLKKNAEWDDNKYKRLIQGVMQSLLRGPTKQSLIDGLRLFTNFNVNVYELYKDSTKVDHSVFEGVNPQFTFILEIEKPLEDYAEQVALMRDANYIVSIIKPAHTINLIITTLVGDESYRKWYRTKYGIDDLEQQLPIDERLAGLPDYYQMDTVDSESTFTIPDSYFGYHHKGLGIFTTNLSKIVGIDVIAPKRVLNDYSLTELDFAEIELIQIPTEYIEPVEIGKSETYNTLSLPTQYSALLDYLEAKYSKANDGNNFSIDATNSFSEHYDFVSSNEVVFQLGSINSGSTLNGISKLGGTSKDVIIDIVTEAHEAFLAQNIKFSLEFSGMDMNETYTYTPLDSLPGSVEYATQSSDVVNLSTITNLIAWYDIETSEKYTPISNILNTITDLLVEQNEQYLITNKVQELMPTLVTELSEVSNTTSKLDEYNIDVPVNFAETINILNFSNIVDDTTFEGHNEAYNSATTTLYSFGAEYTEIMDLPGVVDSIEIQHAENVPNTTVDNLTAVEFTQLEIYNVTTVLIIEKTEDISLPEEEIIAFASHESIPRFIFNSTPLNSARLGGTIVDQYTMVAG